MTEPGSLEFSGAQIKLLEKLLKAGFQFATVERITRYLAVEKSGFLALLDPANGRLQMFGQVGYRVGAGIGMLTEQGGKPVFVWKKAAISATPNLLTAYSRVKDELAEILGE